MSDTIKADMGQAFYEASNRAWGAPMDWSSLNQSERDNMRQAAKEFAALLRANAAVVPKASDLLVLAVEHRVLPMSKVMDADLQDALSGFARALLAAAPSAPVLAEPHKQQSAPEILGGTWFDMKPIAPLQPVQGGGDAATDPADLLTASVVGLASALRRVKAGQTDSALEVISNVRNLLIEKGKALALPPAQPAPQAQGVQTLLARLKPGHGLPMSGYAPRPAATPTEPEALPVQGDDFKRAEFEAWLIEEVGSDAAMRWPTETSPGYANTRIQDYRTGWVECLRRASLPTSGVPGIVPTLLSALNGMLTFFGMDEDENSKAVFDRARKAEAMAQGWVGQPYTTIDMGHGKWEVGAGTNADLPCIAFGKNGSGKVGELITLEPRQMSAEETFAVITFANAEGLAVLEEKVSEVRELFFPGAAPQPAAARVGLSETTSHELIAVAIALEQRRILEGIKAVAALQPLDAMPTPYQAAWHGACEEVFFRATYQQWHMDEDASRFSRESAHGIASPQEDGGTHAPA